MVSITHNSVIINNTTVAGMYAYMDMLKKDGLLVNIDFYFRYYPPYHDSISKVEFIFVESKYALFYKLRWE